MSSSSRAGFLLTTLVASLMSLPASGEDPRQFPVSTPGFSPAVASPAATALWQGRFLGAPEATVPDAERSEEPTGEKRGRRPPPPPALATFTNSVVVGGQRYTYTMIGSDPSTRRARNVTVPVLIIPVRLEFPDGAVLDPTAPDPCLNGAVPLDLTLQSPLFQNFDYGDGPRQFLEELRRLEFWHYTAPGRLNPGYSIRLSASVLPTLAITLPPGNSTVPGSCGGSQRSGRMDFDGWLQYLSDQVAPQLPKMGVNASTFVLFLLDHTNLTFRGNPVAGGFHSTLPIGRAVVTYATAQLGKIHGNNVVDFENLSHEFAEWLDDPSVLNPTPPWGNTGQVTGCQSNLEVGDPLSGTPLPALQMPNGYQYQPQETAFFSWFYDQVPSLGFEGWYSSGGDFTAPATPCQETDR